MSMFVARKFASPAEVADGAAFALADELIDKLKLLNWERFCAQQSIAVPLAISFALPIGEAAKQWQFYVRLCSWLAREANLKHSISVHDAPATIAEAIARCCSTIGIDIAVTRLRTPYGSAACTALNALADAALQARQFVFQPINFPTEQEPTASVDNDDEQILVEEQNWAIDDDAEETVQVTNVTADGMQDELIPCMDEAGAAAWLLETERVTPQLIIAAPTKSWRTSLAALSNGVGSVDSFISTSCVILEQTAKALSDDLNTQTTREKLISTQLGPLV